MEDLADSRLVERVFTAALNYHIHIRELLYQLRIELGILVFEILNEWNVTWIIPF